MNFYRGNGRHLRTAVALRDTIVLLHCHNYYPLLRDGPRCEATLCSLKG